MFQAKLKIEVLNEWVLGVINKFDCELNLLYCANIDKNNVLDVIMFSNMSKQEELTNFLNNQKSIVSLDILDKNEKYLICKIITNYESIINFVLDKNCFLLENIIVKNNFEYWKIGSNNKENIKKLIEALKQKREVKLLELKKYNFESKELTEKQYTIIDYAFKRGYFDIPKKITIESLSSELNISKSTLAVHLQKAERQIVSIFLENEYVRQ